MPAELHNDWRGFSRFTSTGFTLIELIVVLAVLSILAALLIPAVSSALQSSAKAECASRLRSIGQAASLYATDHNGKLPPSNSTEFPGGGRWPRHLQPYLGENPVEIPYRESTKFICPTQEDRGYTRGEGIFGYNQFFMQDQPARNWSRLADIIDPAKLPLFATTSGEGREAGSTGGSGMHLALNGPHFSAARYGYSGSTYANGPAPNFDGVTLYLMADMSVMQTDELWPWEVDGSSFHPKGDKSINPPSWPW